MSQQPGTDSVALFEGVQSNEYPDPPTIFDETFLPSFIQQPHAQLPPSPIPLPVPPPQYNTTTFETRKVDSPRTLNRAGSLSSRGVTPDHRRKRSRTTASNFRYRAAVPDYTSSEEEEGQDTGGDDYDPGEVEFDEDEDREDSEVAPHSIEVKGSRQRVRSRTQLGRVSESRKQSRAKGRGIERRRVSGNDRNGTRLVDTRWKRSDDEPPTERNMHTKPMPRQRRRLMEIGALPDPSRVTEKSKQDAERDRGLQARTCERCAIKKLLCDGQRNCSSCYMSRVKCVHEGDPPEDNDVPLTGASSEPICPDSQTIDQHDRQLDHVRVPKPEREQPLQPFPTDASSVSSVANQPRTSQDPKSNSLVRSFPIQTYSNLLIEHNRLTKLTDILSRRWCVREQELARIENRDVRRCVSMIDVGFLASTPPPTSAPSEAIAAVSEGVSAVKARTENREINFRHLLAGDGGNVAHSEEEGRHSASSKLTENPEKDSAERDKNIQGDERQAVQPETSNAMGEGESPGCREGALPRQTAEWEDAAILLTLSQPQAKSRVNSPEQSLVNPTPASSPAVVEHVEPVPDIVVDLPGPVPIPSRTTVESIPRNPLQRNILAGGQLYRPLSKTFAANGQLGRSRSKTKRVGRSGHAQNTLAHRSFRGNDHSLLQLEQLPPGYQPIVSREMYGKDKNGQDLPPMPPTVRTRPSPLKGSRQLSSIPVIGTIFDEESLALPIPPHSFYRAPALRQHAGSPRRPQRYDPYPRRPFSRPSASAALSETVEYGPPSFRKPPSSNATSDNLITPANAFRFDRDPAQQGLRPSPHGEPITINPRDFLAPPLTPAWAAQSSHAKNLKQDAVVTSSYLPLKRFRADPKMVPPSYSRFYPTIPGTSLGWSERHKLVDDYARYRARSAQRDYREKRRKWHEKRFMKLLKGQGRSLPPAIQPRAVAGDPNIVTLVRMKSDGAVFSTLRSRGKAGGGKSQVPARSEDREGDIIVDPTFDASTRSAVQAEETRAPSDANDEQQRTGCNRLHPVIVPVEPYRSKLFSRPINSRSSQDPMFGIGLTSADVEQEDPTVTGCGPSKQRLSTHWSSVLNSPISTTPASPAHSGTLASILSAFPAATSSVFDDSLLPSPSTTVRPRFSPLESTPMEPTSMTESTASHGEMAYGTRPPQEATDYFDERFEPRLEREAQRREGSVDAPGPF